ncbi:GntR family transcriptional regulator [Sinorhizobium meliloti]|uniref:GntR family transcriptional regulator n=1 Tax=Rhizobium meliloti TaxID=382 RepID=UPI000FDC1A34|nr:GntR family transcriptional regulator [Sinorhizobium meliloti]RVI58611.1 GntR family transcriptional regulator [Sinorhizobium meliloti]RVK85544.1 GntR family transcriptional regulator [Sinorhizobium meliloti]
MRDADREAFPLGRLIYEEIKSDLLALRLAPGAELQEQELADRYSGSRTPVREALSRLVAEELVVRVGRAYVARDFKPNDIRDLYDFREALECTAVRLCAERASQSLVEKLQNLLLDQAAKAMEGDRAGFGELDRAFHLTIAEGSQNALLEKQIVMVHDQIRIVRARELKLGSALTNALEGHKRIQAAIARRASIIAEEEMRFHIREVAMLFDPD